MSRRNQLEIDAQNQILADFGVSLVATVILFFVLGYWMFFI